MIPIKSKKEIRIIRRGGRILSRVMAEVMRKAKPGMKTKELDALAEKLILKNKAQPSFKMVEGYHFASCININDGLIHGLPGHYRLKEGDLVTLDIGVYFQGFHTDKACTFLVRTKNDSFPAGKTSASSTSEVKSAETSEVSPAKVKEVESFLEVGKLALKKAIAAAQPGHRVGHLSQVIEETIKKAGYAPSPYFTGHGIGKKLHEEPSLPCVLKEKISQTPKLKAGLVLAIEVIYSQGGPEVKLQEDGWTTKTGDGQLGALWEDTVVITKKGPQVITGLPSG